MSLQKIQIHESELLLHGHLTRAEGSKAWIVFVHGSGSSHMSSRNNWVAGQLNQQGFSTLLFDLLTSDEDRFYENRFDIPLLSRRLQLAVSWLKERPEYQGEPLAFFGASTGAAAALRAGAEEEEKLFTIISRGGRPDLAGPEFLQGVSVPVLLIVGDLDHQVIELNQLAAQDLSDSRLSLVSGATHLFEEPGTLDEVVKLTVQWLQSHLRRDDSHPTYSVSP